MTTEGYDPKTTIYPTFDCFTDAMDFLDHVAREDPEVAERVVLVHAVCISDCGREFAHAWIEDTKHSMAIFCGIYMDQKIYLAAPLANFYIGYTVKESTRYTVKEAIEENLRTFNFGPWEEKYITLCNKGEKGMDRVLGGGYMENVVQIGVLPKHEKQTNKEDK